MPESRYRMLFLPVLMVILSCVTNNVEDGRDAGKKRDHSTLFTRRPMAVERERPAEWDRLVYGGRFMDRFEPMPARKRRWNMDEGPGQQLRQRFLLAIENLRKDMHIWQDVRHRHPVSAMVNWHKGRWNRQIKTRGPFTEKMRPGKY